MSAATSDIIADFSRDLAHQADTVGRGTGLALGVGWAIIRNERKSREAIKATRLAVSFCAHACESGACLAEVQRVSGPIRDNYLKIASAMRGLPWPWSGYLGRRVENALAEWDELTEDCAIASGPEIRQVLGEIATRM